MASDKYLTVSIDVGYGNGRAFQSQGLTFPMNSIVGILGRNGAGKTTLLKCITGLFPTSGVIWNKPQRLGALIETPRFKGNWTALQQLQYHGKLYGIAEGHIEDTLKQTGLLSVADKPIHTYSLGQKQRLGIAKALLAQPNCLILDEPTNGLDPQGIAEVRALIQHLHKTGMNIILSSHLLGEVQACCTHLVVIDNQTVHFSGPISDYSTQGILVQSTECELLQKFLEEKAWKHFKQKNGFLIEEELSTAEVNQQCFEAGITLSHLSMYEGSLETSFMERS